MLKALLRNQGKIFTWLGYLLVSLFFIFPIFWVVSLAFRTPEEVFKYPPSLVPMHPTFQNFIEALKTTSMARYISNSLQLVVYTVMGTLLVSIPASYAFSRFRFRNKGTVLFLILVFQMISPIVVGIPIYRYFSALGLLNSYFGLSMVYIAIQVPFTTYLLKGVFDAIPRELDEAARIDGASRLQLLRKVIIPVSLPGIASAIIFISINAWSQFLIPFLLLDQEKSYPVSVGILMAQGTYQEISIQLVAAASVMALLPAILMVLFMQKFIIKALVAGAVKG